MYVLVLTVLACIVTALSFNVGVTDAVKALKAVLGDREYNGRRGHYNFYVRQLLDMYGQQGVAEGAKVDRMVKHIEKSEKKLGKSNKEAENIAWNFSCIVFA